MWSLSRGGTWSVNFGYPEIMHTPTTPEELDAMLTLGVPKGSEVVRHLDPLIHDNRFEFRSYTFAVEGAARVCHFLGMHDYEDELAFDKYVTRGSMYVIIYKEPRFRFWDSRMHFRKYASIAHAYAGKPPVGDLDYS